MANSRYDVEINGDNKGLSKAIDKSMDELNKLDSAAQGLFSNFTGPLNGLKDGIGTIGQMTPALRALGAAGLAAGAGIAALNHAASIVEPLNQLSKSTGVSVEMLQKLQSEFKTTGLEVEKFGDFNKDTLDKIGDSFREGGGGIADDLEKWGIGLERYIQYANDAEGGIKALIQTFYDLKEAGKSHAEITNAMESLASDSSHLISTLEQYGSTQEALNAIQSRTAKITNETASEFEEYQKNIDSLGKKVDEFTVNSMGPLAKELNDIWDWFNRDWENTKFFKNLKELNKKGISPSGMSSGQVQNLGKGPAELEKERQEAELKAKLDGQLALAKADIAGAKKRIADDRLKEQYEKQKAEKEAKELEKQQRERERAAAKAKSERDKALQEQEQAAREQKAIYDKMMRDREVALQTLSQIDADVLGTKDRTLAAQMSQLQLTAQQIDELEKKGIISAEQAGARRKMLFENSAKEFKQSLITNPEEIGNISKSLEIVYQQQLEQLEAKKAQSLISQQEYNTQIEALQQDHQQRLEAIKATAGDGNMSNLKNLDAIGFATDEEKMAIQQKMLEEQFQKMQEQNQKLYDGQLISYEDYLKQKQRLDQAYAVKSKAITFTEIQTKLQMYNGFASGMGAVIAGISGENSKAAQAMFAVEKGTAIASGMLNAYESATASMAKYPGPLGYALAASSYARVIGQVMQMKSVNLTGMAHDGISNVPREGTWLLDGGERVVDERTNGDLKDFLDNQKTGGETKIDASIHVSGNVTDQRWFAEQLKRQQQNIAAIVQDSNRRKM
ncbi:hypothetical protein [Citrobacter freundii]|uniref:hypothetical protein n=1 Tax=Citrobacter freundii TaxID=546 RepID=UPI0024C19BF0|nr:hypothetical protein [Citrobacter freundii]WHW90854.1 hypothetical protein P0S03_16325 [Citrobacter freundii]